MIRAAFIACLFAAPAVAQSQCGPTKAVIESLTGRYGEVIVAEGIMADQQGNVVALMQTFANPTTGSFTVLLTSPDGKSCMVASGGSYEAIKAKDQPKGIEG